MEEAPSTLRMRPCPQPQPAHRCCQRRRDRRARGLHHPGLPPGSLDQLEPCDALLVRLVGWMQ